MTKLSICIPMETAAQDVLPLVRLLLENPHADIEVVVAKPANVAVSDKLATLLASEPRATLADAAGDIPRQLLWRTAIATATGDWVTLINARDAIEPELASLLAFVERKSPEADAFGWTAIQIDPMAEPGNAGSVAIPEAYQIEKLDKTAMLKAFFYWEGSLNVPKMPFGIHHAAIRRSLVDTLLQLPAPQDWSTPVPQYEWAAKVLLFANELVFCPRPLSAINATPYVPSTPTTPWNFPFHSGLGLTGAITEVQFHILRELGSPWAGGNEAFVRALMIDCMKEPKRADFTAKGNAYFAALKTFEDGRLAGFFRPEFHEIRPKDMRRGLHDKALLIDRFIAGARTPQEFFGVCKSIFTPIAVLCLE